MSPASIPPALSLSRPLISIAWERFVFALHAAAAALRRRRRHAAHRRIEWRQWQAVRHLTPHQLRDIGAQQLQSCADAEQVREEWKVRASMLGLG